MHHHHRRVIRNRLRNPRAFVKLVLVESSFSRVEEAVTAALSPFLQSFLHLSRFKVGSVIFPIKGVLMSCGTTSKRKTLKSMLLCSTQQVFLRQNQCWNLELKLYWMIIMSMCCLAMDCTKISELRSWGRRR